MDQLLFFHCMSCSEWIKGFQRKRLAKWLALPLFTFLYGRVLVVAQFLLFLMMCVQDDNLVFHYELQQISSFIVQRPSFKMFTLLQNILVTFLFNLQTMMSKIFVVQQSQLDRQSQHRHRTRQWRTRVQDSQRIPFISLTSTLTPSFLNF